MRISILSDTHLFHPEVKECDLVIHAGDACRYGNSKELKKFIKWYQEVPAKRKIYVPGNHDKIMKTVKGQSLLKDTGIDLLMGEGIEIGGFKIWGSPTTPRFFDWAFMAERGKDIAYQWKQIPDDTDILITHGPPYGHGDYVPRDNRVVGCLELLKRVKEIQPKLHIFGHIHEGRGITRSDEIPGTIFINASIVDRSYQPVYQPWEVEL